nr:MAG TPA: hypothetical protein [Inoviridae sp.]
MSSKIVHFAQPTWTKACIFLQAFVFIEFFRVRTLHFPHPSKDRLFLSGGAECFSAICEVSL